ncbi:MAG: tetratricopeptide repeat protein [Desulfobacteraceae bacterium]|nr:MAG: tetratricopeptide repeat protein [Desulfobacteraceae bacterium]
MAALTYEVAWTRVLAMMIGSSTYAFTMILAAFVTGLALGSAVCARYISKVRHPMGTLGLAQILMGVSALAVVPLFGVLPFYLTQVIAKYSDGFWQLQAVEFFLVLGIVFIPTLLMGAAFPLATHIFSLHRKRTGESVGTVYGANTLGTIIGSALAGFVLIPLIGTQKTIYAATGLNLFAAVLFILVSGWIRGKKVLRFFVPVPALLLICMAFIPAWNVNALTFGPFYQAIGQSSGTTASRHELRQLAKKPEVLFHRDGPATSVTIKDLPDQSRVLFINGKPDASSRGDLPSQLLVAHLPLMMHPDPKDTLVIGLASGITLGAATLHPAERIDCLEISPTMVEASHYFDDYNYRPLENPRVNLILGDGRNHLVWSPNTYDVIISEPSNPYFAGMADLFTLEFFELMKHRLNRGGLACAWVQSYLMDKETFQGIVKAFHTVFPGMTLWKSLKGDCMMVGAKDKLQVDLDILKTRMTMPGIQKDLARINIHDLPDFLGHLLTGPAGCARLCEGAYTHTDDNLFAEYAAPKALIGGNILKVPLINRLEQVREADFSFITAPGKRTDGQTILEAAKNHVNARGRVYAYYAKKREQGVSDISILKTAAQLNPGDTMLHEAADRFRSTAYHLFQDKRLNEAIREYENILTLFPSDAKANYNLGILFRHAGKLSRAVSHFLKAAQADPNYYQAHFNLGQIHAQTYQYTKARRHLEKVLEINPEFDPARSALARISTKL